MARSARTCFVYFILDETCALIKIGFTAADPRRRMSSITSGNPHRLALLGYYATAALDGPKKVCREERRLHRLFAAFRFRHEWFSDCAPIRAHIAASCDNPPQASIKTRNKCYVCNLRRKVRRELCAKCLRDGVIGPVPPRISRHASISSAPNERDAHGGASSMFSTPITGAL